MILIVDDRPENILPLKKILELHQFPVDSAESGEEALKKVLKTNYSVIILDVQMPGMDGFEVATAIAGFSKARDTSIIFLSAVNTEKKFITKGYSSGGIDYLTKPVDPDILVLKVKTLHRLYKQQEELREAQKALQKEVEVRKRAQEALADRMQELQSVMESLPQIAFTVTTEGRIEYVNNHWFLYSQDENTFPELHPDDHHICDDWEIARARGEEFFREVRLRDLHTKAYRFYLLRIVPVRQQDSILRWVGTFSDIHPQKVTAEMLEQEVSKRTQELLAKNNELERTNHELQQFAWVVSHDLKEPLRKIQVFNDMVKENYLKDNPEAVSYLDRSIRASARMARLIKDLLAYSQLTMPAPFVPTNLNELMQELMTDFEETINRKNARITVETLPVVEIVPGRIRQVFQNLISNALKFSRSGEAPDIRIRAELISGKDIDSPVCETGDYCRIIVEDNGIGFDEKFLDRIFVIFQRLETQGNYEGTGIGLAIAKKNIDKHGGLIWARSKVNEGSQFIIVLPLVQDPEPAVALAP